MKILVTGGAGYLGSVLVHKLIEQGHDVTVLDICMIGAEGLLSLFSHKRFSFVYGDIRDASLLKKVLKTKFDAVVHLAALVGEPACEHNPDLAWQINHKATVALAKIAKESKVARFIFMSSSSNYGVSEANQLADENSPLNPRTLYAETKVRAEKDLSPLSSDSFAITIIRLAMLFGLSPRMRFNLLINELTRDACFGKELVLYKQNSWRPYTHTQDAVEAVIAILEARKELISSQVFNVGTENYRKKDLLLLIKKHFPAIAVVDRGGAADNRDYRVSFDKIKRTLHFKPTRSVADGIEEIIWAVKNGVFPNPFDENYSCWIRKNVFD